MPFRPGWLHGLRHGLPIALLLWQSLATAAPSVREIEQQFRRGEVAQALARAEEALAQEPGLPALQFLRGVMLSEAGRVDEAAQAFQRMTLDFPELPEPYNNLAVLLAGRGQLDPARALLQSALQLDPGYRVAHQNLGDVLLRLAERAYAAAASGARPEPGLQRKLRLVRELVQVAAP